MSEVWTNEQPLNINHCNCWLQIHVAPLPLPVWHLKSQLIRSVARPLLAEDVGHVNAQELETQTLAKVLSIVFKH